MQTIPIYSVYHQIFQISQITWETYHHSNKNNSNENTSDLRYFDDNISVWDNGFHKKSCTITTTTDKATW